MNGPEGLDALLTEQADPRYAQLDQASVAELARLMNEADASVPAAIAASMGAIVPAIEAITERLARGGRLPTWCRHVGPDWRPRRVGVPTHVRHAARR